MLDLGAGEGGVLVGLPGLPAFAVATEEWMPTVAPAAQTVKPRGINLIVCGGAQDNTNPSGPRRTGLPFKDSSYDVVLARHEAFDAAETRRILKPGGRFITQQVGSGARMRDAFAALHSQGELRADAHRFWLTAEATSSAP